MTQRQEHHDAYTRRLADEIQAAQGHRMRKCRNSMKKIFSSQ
jgi:hypothetical protein